MKQKVAIVGATGLVGRRLAELLIDHPWFELAMLVGSSDSVGTSYRQIWEKKESALQAHYGPHLWKPRPFPEPLAPWRVATFDELLASNIQFVFSSIPERAGHLEDRLLDAGRTVFSNSSHGRFDPANPLVVPEANLTALQQQRFIKNPNCVTSGLVIILSAVHQLYGLREASITTYQSISGRGDAKYAPELVHHNIYPLHNSAERTEEFIRREVKKILDQNLLLSVSCNRVSVQEGHYVDVRIKTAQPITDRVALIRSLNSFSPLRDMATPTRPLYPIVVIDEVGRPRPNQDAWYGNGMAVAVGNISTTDEIYDLRLSYVVNNVVRGAAGGALLNAEIYTVLTHLSTPSRSDHYYVPVRNKVDTLAT